MLRCGLGAIFFKLNLLLRLSCYKLACHYFHTLAEYFMYSHLPYFLYIAAMLYCSEDEDFLMKIPRLVGPRSSASGMVPYSVI
jgi:hypothetical protein